MLRRHLFEHPLLLGKLLDADVDPRDRDWFDGCRIDHLERLPGLLFDGVRLVMIIVATGVYRADLIVPLVLASALATMGQMHLRGVRARGVDNSTARMRWSRFIVLRGFVFSLISVLALMACPTERLIPLLIMLITLQGLEMFSQFPFPVPTLLANWTWIAASSLALLLRPGQAVWLILMLLPLQMMSAHVRLFNLYYLFATRRLRTRKLTVANETIRLLLNQYDEHGSDCLVEADSRGRIRSPSERLCRMFGQTAEQLEGRKLSHCFDAGPEREMTRRAGRACKPFRDLVGPVTTPEGQRWWSLSGCPIFDGSEVVIGFRGFIRDVTDRHVAESRVRFLANHDVLTRLANRAEFHARLNRALERIAETDKERDNPQVEDALAVLFIDLDRFKLINDSLGHAAGDHVLVEAARRLRQELRGSDLVARLGGDEFAVLVHGPVNAGLARAMSERIIARLCEPIAFEERTVQVGASIGIALAGQHGMTGDALLRAADLALYEAKAAGRGQSCIYSADLLRDMADRQAMELELRDALTKQQFLLHYQPLFALESGSVAGYEALLRWNHPERGLVDPGLFIPLAEESGLIVPIGEWVLREAMAEAATWPDTLTVAVNVSARQFRDGELLRQVVSALSFTGFDPHRLELEITETMLIQNEGQCLRVLHRLRELGVRIALDDFGTGYSSLNYLRSFPFDKIKIDRCFVDDLGADRGADPDIDPGEGVEDSAAIVEAVLNLAARLNMQTIAEGVEEPHQLERLRAKGCGQVQGYLTGRAMPAQDLPIERVTARAEPDGDTRLSRTG